MHPTQSYVRSKLEPFYEPICEMYDRAWARYETFPQEERAVIVRENRTLAGNIWSIVTDEAFRWFMQHGITPRRAPNTWEFPVAPHICLRFKKTSSTGVTSNYRTPRANRYDGGLVLGDVPEGLRVTAGWVPNLNGTGIEDVLISLRGPVQWAYSILPKPALVDLFDTFEQDDSDTGPIIRPRHDKDADDASTGAAGDQ